MQIRPATRADADGIAAAHVAAWQAGYRGVMPDAYLDGLPVDRFAANWASQLADPGAATVLVGVADGEVVGFTVVGPSRDDDAAPGTGELWSVNLTPAHWGRGLGQALTSAAMDALRDRGHHNATLWVVAVNDRAQRTYRRLGWTPEGTEKTDTFGGAAVTEIRLHVGLPALR